MLSRDYSLSESLYRYYTQKLRIRQMRQEIIKDLQIKVNKNDDWDNVVDVCPRHPMPSLVGGREIFLEPVFLTERFGVSIYNQMVEIRCTLCDDRVCVQTKGLRRTYWMNGDYEVSGHLINECEKRKNLFRFLNGEIELREALNDK